jgi:DNA-binding LacI/PurR family transcriptional regulator
MSISITAIAKKLKISRVTVSNALANRGRMRPDLRKKILSYANKYSYRPNVNLARLRRGKSDQILFGALIEKNGVFDFNHAILIYFLANILMGKGYDLVIHPFAQSKESWSNIIEKVRNKSVDGVILQLDTTMVPEFIQDLVKTSIPVAVYDSSSDAMDNSLIDTTTCSFLDSLIQSFKSNKFTSETEVFCIAQNEVYDDRLIQDFFNVTKIFNFKNINPVIKYDAKQPEMSKIWRSIIKKKGANPAMVLFRSGDKLEHALYELRSIGSASTDNIHIYSLKHEFDCHEFYEKNTNIIVDNVELIAENLVKSIMTRMQTPTTEATVNILPGKTLFKN